MDPEPNMGKGNKDNRKASKIDVPSNGGDPPRDGDGSGAPKVRQNKDGGKKKKKQEEKDELSEEDMALKTALEGAVEACGGSDTAAVAEALALMAKEIKTATSSMTSVPKPLKFLNPHFDTLVSAFEGMDAGANKVLLADILAALAMTRTINGKRELLRYKMLGDRKVLAEWGHEFVRSLAGEIGEEFHERQLADPPKNCDDLLAFVYDIVPFFFKHNAEPEAIDLLMETGEVGKLVGPWTGAGDNAAVVVGSVPSGDDVDTEEKNEAGNSGSLVTPDNHAAVCLYMLRCADYLDNEEEEQLLEVAYELYRAHGKAPDALRVSLRLGDVEKTTTVLEECEDEAVKKQMGYILSRHHTRIVDDDETLAEIMGNLTLSEKFASLAKELDVLEPKTPEQIYKSHLSETGSTAREGKAPESARGNLASTFVNAFVNAGYCKDSLVTPDDSRWVFKHKPDGKLSAAAAYGMIIMWSVDNLTDLDDLLEDSDDNIKAGALLGIGVACAGIRSDLEPAMGLIGDYLTGDAPATHNMKMASLLGMGLAYAGTADESVMEYMSPFVADDSAGANMELVAMAGLALGMVFVGTADETVAAILADRLMEATDAECEQAVTRQLCLGLGLVFLRQQENVTATQEVVGTIEHPIGEFANMVLRVCAYAGTGNVLEVQSLLHKCAEHPGSAEEEEKKTEGGEDGKQAEGAQEAKKEETKEAKFAGYVQSMAVIGIALVTMGDELGVDMAARSAEHLLQYGDAAVRRTVPLGLALINLSNPEYTVVDTLSKLSHDTDKDVAQNAILALGLCGAGTNNSRVAGMLRQLVAFYKREAEFLFCIRVAQGLLHMGKGLMTVNPFHSDRLLMSHVAVAGILPVLMCGLDLEATLHSKWHFLLYSLSIAMKPRMLVTVDEDGNELNVDVRVGQALETVGQAGKKRSITGFQTHASPVLLSAGERAELATGEYKPLTSVLEGVVILRKDPEWAAEQAAKKAAIERKNARRRNRSRTASAASGAGFGAGAGAPAGSK